MTFGCPSCRQMISAAVPSGTQVQCPLCHQRVIVPEVSPSSPEPVRAPVMMQYSQHVDQPQHHGMPVAALIFGILGLVACPLLGVPGLLLGWLSLNRIKRDPIRYGGRGMAIASLCTGGVSLVFLFLAAIYIYPIFKTGIREHQEFENREDCELHVRSIADALFYYAQRGGKFPPDLDVLIDQGELTQANLNCPSDAPDSISYYYVPGYELLSDPEQIILYENPLIHGGDGGHILTVGNTISFVESPEFEERIGAITLPDGMPFAPHED
ncbi:MAG: DUF4190 domain-containing protein [Phycisphaerales bacterium]|nr:DUF4190 domain-containing protein [Phycisphaerales bacterium]